VPANSVTISSDGWCGGPLGSWFKEIGSIVLSFWRPCCRVFTFFTSHQRQGGTTVVHLPSNDSRCDRHVSKHKCYIHNYSRIIEGSTTLAGSISYTTYSSQCTPISECQSREARRLHLPDIPTKDIRELLLHSSLSTFIQHPPPKTRRELACIRSRDTPDHRRETRHPYAQADHLPHHAAAYRE
jgi:hypothetical protein